MRSVGGWCVPYVSPRWAELSRIARWKGPDVANNIEQYGMKIKVPYKNDKTAVAPSNCRFVPSQACNLCFFPKCVRTYANIERLARFVVVLVRSRQRLNDFDGCPASHHITYAGFIERRPVHQALVSPARRRCTRSFMRMFRLFIHHGHCPSLECTGFVSRDPSPFRGSRHAAGGFGLFFILR
jgi:hypothetical protein